MVYFCNILLLKFDSQVVNGIVLLKPEQYPISLSRFICQIHLYTNVYFTDDPRQQSGCLMNTTDQTGDDPEMYTQESILPNILDSLPEDKYTQELKDAAEQVKLCDDEGPGSYSQCRLKDYLTAVKRFVENNSPALPTNSQQHVDAYLSDAMILMCSKVTALVPVLKDSELVSYLLDSYNRHLFDMLYMLMDRSSVKDAFFLLQWVKMTYFR